MGPRPRNELFTPEIMVLEPRRGGGLCLTMTKQRLSTYYESTPKIGEGKTKRWKVMDIATDESTVAIEGNGTYEVYWLSDEPGMIIALNKVTDYPNYTDVMIYNIHKREEKHRAARIFSRVQGS
ncbi:hypothetical protein F4811DRAFT_251039 [Daldinia bambusicola]|nr:hypothetical protein F4811DRAFT_251039 [Daldinia bambusicola]